MGSAVSSASVAHQLTANGGTSHARRDPRGRVCSHCSRPLPLKPDSPLISAVKSVTSGLLVKMFEVDLHNAQRGDNL